MTTTSYTFAPYKLSDYRWYEAPEGWCEIVRVDNGYAIGYNVFEPIDELPGTLTPLVALTPEVVEAIETVHALATVMTFMAGTGEDAEGEHYRDAARIVRDFLDSLQEPQP